ncbi:MULTISPECIES: MucBP domain-containing protein [Furfurilactobacillus]|uniref:LPXTG cell wall anchor domain-containing protein n=1 Tax=Furfurilactobacillus rossiae TaxID=231049 RepID=A0A7C9ISM2_9LACO|nr:MucBP domain-containing protein [Furfurilactobacillus milii]MYV05340.1 LPXTG cell wall anchor domain-containing protein [Furfurilactobacillus milii]
MSLQRKAKHMSTCHYKLYKSGKFWITASVAVFAIEAGGLTQANAATTVIGPTTTITQSTTQPVPDQSSTATLTTPNQQQRSQLPQNSQVNSQTSVTTTSATTSQAESTATESSATSSSLTAPSAAPEKTSSSATISDEAKTPAITPINSEETGASSVTATSESSQSPSTQATSVTSAARSSDSTESTSVSNRNATLMAAASIPATTNAQIMATTATITADSTHADSDIVDIEDAQLKQAMLNAFQVTSGELTYGDVRHITFVHSKNEITILLIPTTTVNPITSLKGIEVLRELPEGWGVQLSVYLKPGVSLVPLTGLHITTAFDIQQDGAGNWTDADIAALNSLTFGGLDYYWGIEFAGKTSMTNTTGLRGDQILKLDPMFTKASQANPNGLFLSLSNQRLSDFSYFAKFSNVRIFSVNNYRVYTDPVHIAQTGDDINIVSQTIGIDGKPILTGYKTYNSDTPIVTIDGDHYVISGSKQYANIGYTIISNQYGVSGYPMYTAVEYANGNTLLQTGMEYYRMMWGNISVNYVDENGNVLADAQHINGDVGRAYATTPKPIAGYSVSRVDGNANGTFTTELQTVTYVYTKNIVQGADVLVTYVDQHGNEISPSEKLTGNIGDSFTSSIKPVDGYTFDHVEGSETGVFTNENQTITYVYTKDAVRGGDITVKYVDTEGNEIVPTQILSGNVGDTYETVVKHLNGYTLSTIDGNANGTFTNTDQTITYIYVKEDGQHPSDNNNDGNGDNPTVSAEPDYSDNAVDSETTNQMTPGQSAGLLPTSVSSSYATSNLLDSASSQSQQFPQSETANNASRTADSHSEELPNTGMHENHLAAMVGAILLGLLGTIPFSSKRKHD